jgi:Ca2+-binding EF-hand superfamily protein
MSTLGIQPDFANQILDIAITAREKKLRSKAVSYYEKMFSEGRISRDDFVNMLISLGYEDEFARKYASLLEYVRNNYYIFTLTKDERSKLANIYIEKYRDGLLNQNELFTKLTELAFTDWEIDLKKKLAEEEYDMQLKKDRLNLLIEQMKQGMIDRKSFVDNCAQTGYIYDKCVELAEYYWTKYIGTDFYVSTKDERKALANALIKKYVDGWIDEDTLREKLKKLRFLDAEIDLMIEKAKEEYESKYLADILAEADAMLKKQEIDISDYVDYLVSLGMSQERAEARARKILASITKKGKK